ncbi:DoxX family membrane protein [Flavobacterium rakeshii]|uniref:DoxX family membrane protein n=1 Tax=Flavobacterium rakeshii TaxID=1038845 RepID=A0A6N8HC85_9FLAO|nr:DoxX family protein [Flavobacterium rakeshii]MEE1898868.1 DoxX family protein [Flavobacterium rakeshii]MUV04124.1 DoxX family membrane protein [Flavobacterium rakeshii]
MWIFDTTRDKRLYNFVLFLIRITIALFMLTHGLKKIDLLLSDEPVQFADPFGIGATASLMLTVFAEVVCSALLIVGLATRLAVLPLIITMVVAVFMIHGSDGFERQELGSIYLMVYVLLLITGSGKYSLDHLICRKKRKMFY